MTDADKIRKKPKKRVDHAFNNARFYRDKSEALENRIAAAPKVWAIKIHDHLIDIDMEYIEKEVAEEDAENMVGARVVLVALVELKSKEMK